MEQFWIWNKTGHYFSLNSHAQSFGGYLILLFYTFVLFFFLNLQIYCCQCKSYSSFFST